MKRITLIITATLIACTTYAQKVSVFEKTVEIDKVPHKGMATSLNLDKNFVEKAWKKKLKDFNGKRSNAKGGEIHEGASISDISSNPIRIFTTVDKGKNGVEVWWAIDMGTSYMEKGGSGWNEAKEILLKFGRQAYVEDINEQIAEAEKAFGKAQKDYEKEVKEGEGLASDVEDNAKEKIKLEQELKENAEELVQLKKDQEQNKKDTEATKKEAEKMKKAIEVVRAKLDAVQ